MAGIIDVSSSVKSSETVAATDDSTTQMDTWLGTGNRSRQAVASNAFAAAIDPKKNAAALVAQTAITILGKAEQAVLMIARDGAVLFQNESARQLLASQPDINVIDGRLACVEGEQDSLEDLIATLPWTTEDDPAVVRVMRLGKGPGALILVGRTVAPAADSGPRVGLIVIHRVEEPEVRHATSLLRQAFSLTRAESAVATMIAGGHTPAEIANHRNVSVETIRAQLRVLYSKTGTNRQAELVRLVHRLTALG